MVFNTGWSFNVVTEGDGIDEMTRDFEEVMQKSNECRIARRYQKWHPTKFFLSGVKSDEEVTGRLLLACMGWVTKGLGGWTPRNRNNGNYATRGKPVSTAGLDDAEFGMRSPTTVRTKISICNSNWKCKLCNHLHFAICEKTQFGNLICWSCQIV